MKTEAQKAGETKIICSLYWLCGLVGAAFPGIYSILPLCYFVELQL